MILKISTIVDSVPPPVTSHCLDDIKNFYYCRLKEVNPKDNSLDDIKNFYYCR